MTPIQSILKKAYKHLFRVSELSCTFINIFVLKHVGVSCQIRVEDETSSLDTPNVTSQINDYVMNSNTTGMQTLTPFQTTNV